MKRPEGKDPPHRTELRPDGQSKNRALSQDAHEIADQNRIIDQVESEEQQRLKNGPAGGQSSPRDSVFQKGF